MKNIFLTVLLTASLIFTLSACGSAAIPQEKTNGTSKPIENASSESASTILENTPSQQTPSSAEIDRARAKEIALNHAKLKEADIKGFEIELDRSDKGVLLYEIEFRNGLDKYEYDILAENGQILNAEKNDINILETAYKKISEEKAKEIALNHAGLKESDIAQYRIEFDVDDGVPSYEIEFKHGKYEYDYDINSSDGTIIKSEKEFND